MPKRAVTAIDEGGAKASRYQRRKEQTRAKLIEAAHIVMAGKGVDAATIQEITEVADVGFGSFYNHFKSKDEIARAVFLERTERLGQLADHIAGTEKDYAQAIAFIGRVYIEMAHADPVWSWFVIHAHNALQLTGDILGKRAVRHFRQGVAAGALKVSDPDLAGALTLSAFLTLMRAILQGEASKAAAVRALGMILRMYGIPDEEIARVLAKRLPAAITTFLVEEAHSGKSLAVGQSSD